MKKVLTDEQYAEVKRLHARGASVSDITNMLNVPRKIVRNICYKWDCDHGIRNPESLREKELRREAIRPKEIAEMRRSLHIGQTIIVVDREYSSSGRRGSGATIVRKTLATICDMDRTKIVALMPAGFKTTFSYTDLIRKDGVRV